MENNRKNIIIDIIYGVLCLLQIIVLGLALMIYTSFNKNFPWYESCGMQFMIIPMVLVPSLIVIGVGLKYLSKKYNMSNFNVKLPFYAAALIVIPILDGSLNRVLIAFGGWICVLLIVVTLYCVVIHYNRKKERETE